MDNGLSYSKHNPTGQINPRKLHSTASDMSPKSYADIAEKPPRNGAASAVTDPPGVQLAAKRQTENQAPSSDSTISRKSPPQKPPKKSEQHYSKVNDTSKQDDTVKHSTTHNTANGHGDALLQEGPANKDGSTLTSTRVSKGYKTALSLDRKEAPAPLNSDLVSGRQAGAGWQKSPIRWAPRSVPLQRRLQTLAVLWHGLCIPGLLAFFLFLCAIPILWPILMPYLLYTIFSSASTSGELSHRWEPIRRSSIWSLFASYYPARLHRSQALEPTRKYIFGYHPHGIISHGAFAAFGTEALGFSQLFPGITNTLLTLDSNFRIPLYRDYILALGLASVSRESCTNLLSKGGTNGEGMGRAITIVVGGARESLDAHPRAMKLVLRRRKGFIKLAIRNGADLVPTLGFGENELYDQFQADTHPFIHKMQLVVKKTMGFTVPLFHARGVFNYDMGLLPYRRPLNIVVGRPILVEQMKLTDEYIDELHQKYMDELVRLWDEWKDKFAKDRVAELEIVE